MRSMPLIFLWFFQRSLCLDWDNQRLIWKLYHCLNSGTTGQLSFPKAANGMVQSLRWYVYCAIPTNAKLFDEQYLEKKSIWRTEKILCAYASSYIHNAQCDYSTLPLSWLQITLHSLSHPDQSPNKIEQSIAVYRYCTLCTANNVCIDINLC